MNSKYFQFTIYMMFFVANLGAFVLGLFNFNIILLFVAFIAIVFSGLCAVDALHQISHDEE